MNYTLKQPKQTIINVYDLWSVTDDYNIIHKDELCMICVYSLAKLSCNRDLKRRIY